MARSRKVHWCHPKVNGETTLRAYGVAIHDKATEEEAATRHEAFRAAVPPTHIAFLKGLRASWRWRDVLFVHAGIDPDFPLDEQIEDDLIWIREPFLQSRKDHGALIVHGHTPVDMVEDHGNRIAIDTGAAYGGELSCVVFEGESATVLGGERLR